MERVEYDPDTWEDVGLEEPPDEDDDSEWEDAELQKFEEGIIRVSSHCLHI